LEKYGWRKGLTKRHSFFKEVQDNMWLFEFTEEEDKRIVTIG
jgi:hypothetical protein